MYSSSKVFLKSHPSHTFGMIAPAPSNSIQFTLTASGGGGCRGLEEEGSCVEFMRVTFHLMSFIGSFTEASLSVGTSSQVSSDQARVMQRRDVARYSPSARSDLHVSPLSVTVLGLRFSCQGCSSLVPFSLEFYTVPCSIYRLTFRSARDLPLSSLTATCTGFILIFFFNCVGRFYLVDSDWNF